MAEPRLSKSAKENLAKLPKIAKDNDRRREQAARRTPIPSDNNPPRGTVR